MFKMTLAFLWAMPFTAAGILVAITIIGLPITLLLFGIGCGPLARLIIKYIHYTVAWEDREHALKANASKPWEEDEDPCTPIVMYESNIERER